MNAVRLAVSPVYGNGSIAPLRTHFLNYILGRNLKQASECQIILRCDDTNPERHEREVFEWLFNIYEQTLGLAFDYTPYNPGPYGSLYQSERTSSYVPALAALRAAGVIDDDSSLPLFCFERFSNIFGQTISVSDLRDGQTTINISKLMKVERAQFPLQRADGTFLYHLVSVVDDANMGITHVVRGQDKASALGYQEAIRIALGYPIKHYLHAPMLLDDNKARLKGEEYWIPSLINRGITSNAILNYLIQSCYSDGDGDKSLDEIIASFNPAKISKAPSQYSEKKLISLQRGFQRTSTDKEFLYGFSYYLEKLDAEVLKIVEKDPYISTLITTERRDFEQLYNYIKLIYKPVYSEPPTEMLQNITDAISKLSTPDPLNITNVDLMAMRWVLLGTVHGPSSISLLNYFDNVGQRDLRLNLARAKIGLSAETKLPVRPDRKNFGTNQISKPR